MWLASSAAGHGARSHHGGQAVKTARPSPSIYRATVKMQCCQGWTLNNTWSSTPNSAGNHYNVNLSNGNVNANNDTNNNYVTCVR
jgi:hypothetical protein